MNYFRIMVLLPLLALLGACKTVVLSPSGDIAAQQGDLVVLSTWLMLVIIVPVMGLTVWFAWHYRKSNARARYEPDWDHSIHLELIIWAAPLLIIICLGALTWVGTHILDPYRPIGRLAPGQALVAGAKPLRVEVVALDWKWLFFYPDYGVATVNEIAAPVNQPIEFRITSSAVMNSFYIPALAGQIYAMPGMETKLYAVINKTGDFRGFSANYSGAGFSGMRFAFHGLTAADFDAWIRGIKDGGGALTTADYLALEQPSENVAARHYASVSNGLYQSILNLCVKTGATCMNDMMGADIKNAVAPDQNHQDMKSMHAVHPAQKNNNEMKMDMDMDMPMSNPK